MIIGCREGFAIEYAYVRGWVTKGQTWLYGHICFWAGGERLGDFEDTYTFGVVIAQGKHILSHRGTRYDPDLMSKSAQEVFRILDNALYVDDERTLDRDRSGWRKVLEICRTCADRAL